MESSNWEEFLDPDSGRIFYQNLKTKETSYSKPSTTTTTTSQILPNGNTIPTTTTTTTTTTTITGSSLSNETNVSKNMKDILENPLQQDLRGELPDSVGPLDSEDEDDSSLSSSSGVVSITIPQQQQPTESLLSSSSSFSSDQEHVNNQRLLLESSNILSGGYGVGGSSNSGVSGQKLVGSSTVETPTDLNSSTSFTSKGNNNNNNSNMTDSKALKSSLSMQPLHKSGSGGKGNSPFILHGEEKIEHIDKEGYLFKKGVYNKDLKKRYFKLHDTKLTYYKKKDDKSAIDEIDLCYLKNLYYGNESKKGFQFVFEIENVNRVYELYCEKEDDMRSWVDSLFKATSIASSKGLNLEQQQQQKGNYNNRIGGVTNFLRQVVSLNKKRFIEGDWNLDLTYILPNLIAMGYPSSGKEAIYRNPLSEVQDFLEAKHKGHYKVYNLCEERLYDKSLFNGRVENFPFQDHHPPPLYMMRPCCNNIQQWTEADPLNVAVIHCKAGKGRTGVICACYLLHCGVCQGAQNAILYFGNIRTDDGKGITIPSQQRYVYYYDYCLNHGFPKTDIRLYLREIYWLSVPVGGCTPNWTVESNRNIIYEHGKHYELQKYEDKPVLDYSEKTVRFLVKGDVMLKGDLKFQFFNGEKKLFHFCINTNFIVGNKLTLKKREIDKIYSDKKHKVYEIFAVTLLLDTV